MKKRSAFGKKGILITGFDGDVFFRQKANNEDGFIDYKLCIYDLDITINDTDAYFDDENDRLDYSDATLGR